MGEIGGISIAEDSTPVSGGKEGRGPGLQQDSGPCKAGSPSTLPASFTWPHPHLLDGCTHHLDNLSLPLIL